MPSVSNTVLEAEIRAHVQSLESHPGGMGSEGPDEEAQLLLLRGIAALLSGEPRESATGAGASELAAEIELQVGKLRAHPIGSSLEGPGAEARVLALRGTAALLRSR
jgi:hypothetical protein